jgi:hypothetical protein
MREAAFPQPVAEVVATVAEIFRHQGQTEVADLLEGAHARFDEVGYDNWNGGTYDWALRLEVPVAVFASAEQRLPKIEKDIAAKLAYISRLYQNDHLGEVTISPAAAGIPAVGQQMAPSDIEVRRLWPDGRFRLFLSHVAAHKLAVSKIKDELGLRGVAAFVAHEDIEPSLEWQREIEIALRSMHALAALITLDFHASFWTDQEVGWALGRGQLVVPVRLGADPYGLAGKFQGLSGTLAEPKALAEAIVDTLTAHPQTRGEMRRALVSAFTDASSFSMAIALSKRVIQIRDLTEDEKESLRTACTENSQVARAHGVRDTIYKALGKPAALAAPKEDDVPF